MKRFKYFWNGKLRGIPDAFILLSSAGLSKIRDKIKTAGARGNLGHCGYNSIINSGVVYRYPGNISIGNNVSIARSVELYSENPESKLYIENDVFLTFNVRLDFSGGLRIGKNTVISKNCIIETHDHGMEPKSSPVFKTLDIGENVWIGMDVLILSNVRKIGNNAIIAAGSVVTHEVLEDTIVGGTPAKLIRKRKKL